MSPSMVMVDETRKEEEDLYQKGVKHLSENGITKLPKKYVWPVSERPNNATKGEVPYTFKSNLNLPIIDFAELQGPNRCQVLKALANACEHYGFFQVGFEVLNTKTEFGSMVWPGIRK